MNIGYDGGFSSIKAVADDRRCMFPSFAVRPRESLFSLNGHSTIIVDGPGGAYLLGEEAVKKGTRGARKETATWINSPEWLIYFLGAYSELTRATQTTVNLVTGLPIADYQRDKQTVIDRLTGTHSFTRQGRYAQVVKVIGVRVVPQAWGAVLDLLLDERGNVADPSLVDSRVAVLDIGGRTVNYLSVDGLSDIPDESKGTDKGAWDVCRAVRQYLDNAHPGLSRMRDHQIMKAVVSGELYDAGEPIDLGPVVNPIIAEIGQEIVDTASQYWGSGAATFRRVIVCGGGAHLWGRHIRAAFRQAVVSDKPVYANARGFYKFAMYLSAEGQW